MHSNRRNTSPSRNQHNVRLVLGLTTQQYVHLRKTTIHATTVEKKSFTLL